MKYLSVLVAACVAGACAGGPRLSVAVPDRPADVRPAAPAEDTLSTYIEKVRKLAAEARPARPVVKTLEAMDPDLSTALSASLIAPSAETYRRVANEYRRLGVFDRAFQYLERAQRLQPNDAATFDALARLWRDSGLPQIALADASRAVYFAPASAVMHNTLGTVLQALGQQTHARAEFERARRLDPEAAYVLNNLCYNWILAGKTEPAIEACRSALVRQPTLVAARNNLALAYGLSGDLKSARETFAWGGERPRGSYNTGILHLARGEYREAQEAFEAALADEPTMTLAAQRVRQAAHAAATRGQE